MATDAFSVEELRATEAAGHEAWDCYCECWRDSGFTGDARLYDIDHLIDVMTEARRTRIAQ